MKRHEIEVGKDDKIIAVHHKSDSDNWIFFSHGFGGNKGRSCLKRCEKMQEEGWNAVRFDFRGNGESSGNFSDQTLSSKIKDLRNVVKYFNPKNFALFGSSFGGKTTYHSLKHLEPEAVILKAPVLLDKTMKRYEELIEKNGSWSIYDGKSVDQRFVDDYQKYNFEENLKNVKNPVLIFHGADDETVEFNYSAEAIKSLPENTVLEKLKDEKHSFSDSAEEYMITRMIAWLRNNDF